MSDAQPKHTRMDSADARPSAAREPTPIDDELTAMKKRLGLDA